MSDDHDMRSFMMNDDNIIVSAERLTKLRDEVSYLGDRAKYYGEIPKTLEKFTAHIEKLKEEITGIIRSSGGFTHHE